MGRRKSKRLKVGGGEEVSWSGGGLDDATAGPSSKTTIKTRTGQNPLENSVVLEHLFGLCPTELIPTCRLVCKQWYNESLATWRNNSTLSFTVRNGDIVVRTDFRYPSHQPMVPLTTLLEYVQNPENKCRKKPYRRIRIQSCEFDSSPQQFQVLWNVLGPNLTTLILYDYTFSTVEEFRKIVYTCCPNLQSLKLSLCIFHGQNSASDQGWSSAEYQAPLYGEHKHLKSVAMFKRYSSSMGNQLDILPVSWLEFFSHFPSLTSFTIAGCLAVGFATARFAGVTSAIRTIRRQNADKLPFKIFSIGSPFWISGCSERKQLLEMARQLSLPLDALRIIATPEVELDFLKSTLNFHAEWVKEIYAFWDKDDNNLTTPTTLMRDFPFGLQLHKLEVLKIDYRLCESFTFLKYMPNLKRLDVVGEVHDEWEGPNGAMFKTTSEAVSNTPKYEMANVKMLKLTKLKVNYVVSADDVKSLIQWMPNVEELIMILNDEKFGIICGGWRRLKRVEDLGYDLTDKGITGRNGREAKGEDTSVSPNITDLQDLQYIDLWTTKLTEDSVVYGFLLLPNLRAIHFNPIEEISWGERTRRALKRRKIRLRR